MTLVGCRFCLGVNGRHDVDCPVRTGLHHFSIEPAWSGKIFCPRCSSPFFDGDGFVLFGSWSRIALCVGCAVLSWDEALDELEASG